MGNNFPKRRVLCEVREKIGQGGSGKMHSETLPPSKAFKKLINVLSRREGSIMMYCPTQIWARDSWRDKPGVHPNVEQHRSYDFSGGVREMMKLFQLCQHLSTLPSDLNLRMAILMVKGWNPPSELITTQSRRRARSRAA